MLTLHTWTTPNGYKPLILLEEMGLKYQTRFVNIGTNEQLAPEFLKISPNNKIPALVDEGEKAPDGHLSLFESGAILTYLADTYSDGTFLAASGTARFKALEWLFWQVGGVGPMFGQLGYFAVRAKEKIEPAIERYAQETERLLGVLDARLAETAYLAGGAYTVADIATYPWIVGATTMLQPALPPVRGFYHVARWLDAIAERPAVQRAMAIKAPPKGD